MISDILSDALHSIEEYEKSMPECYSGKETQKRLSKCKREMESLRIYLDTPPTTTKPNQTKGKNNE